MCDSRIERTHSNASITSAVGANPFESVNNYAEGSLERVKQEPRRVAESGKKTINLFRQTASVLNQALNGALTQARDTPNSASKGEPATKGDKTKISRELIEELPAPRDNINSKLATKAVEVITNDPHILGSLAKANYVLYENGVDEKKVHSLVYEKASKSENSLPRLVCSAVNKTAVKFGNLFRPELKYIKPSVNTRIEVVKRTSQAVRHEITQNQEALRASIDQYIKIFGSFNTADNGKTFELDTNLDSSNLSKDQEAALKKLIAYSQILVASLDKVDFQPEIEIEETEKLSIGEAAKTLMELPIKKADRLVTEDFQKWMKAFNTLCEYRLSDTGQIIQNNDAQATDISRGTDSEPPEARSGAKVGFAEEEKSDSGQPYHPYSPPYTGSSAREGSDSESSDSDTESLREESTTGSGSEDSETDASGSTRAGTEEEKENDMDSDDERPPYLASLTRSVTNNNESKSTAVEGNGWIKEPTRPTERPVQARPQQNGLLRPLLDLIQECLPFGATNNYEPTGEGEPLNNQPLSDAEPLLGHSWYENIGKFFAQCVSDDTLRENTNPQNSKGSGNSLG